MTERQAMHIQIKNRHSERNDPLHDCIQQEVRRLSERFSLLSHACVTLSPGRRREHVVELHLRGHELDLRCEERGPDALTTLFRTLARAERRLGQLAQRHPLRRRSDLACLLPDRPLARLRIDA